MNLRECFNILEGKMDSIIAALHLKNSVRRLDQGWEHKKVINILIF